MGMRQYFEVPYSVVCTVLGTVDRVQEDTGVTAGRDGDRNCTYSFII
jgi:hypothetical protein